MAKLAWRHRFRVVSVISVFGTVIAAGVGIIVVEQLLRRVSEQVSRILLVAAWGIITAGVVGGMFLLDTPMAAITIVATDF